MTFGQRLSKAREEAGLTQDELSQKLYITRQGLSRWENDKTQPSIETLALICKTLGKQPDYFIETGERPPHKTYKQLTYNEKMVAFDRWKRERCRYVNLIFTLLFMIMNIAVGVITFFSMTLANFSGLQMPVISGLVGGVLLYLCSLIYVFLLSHKYAVLYNEYLLSELNVVRTGKLLIV